MTLFFKLQNILSIFNQRFFFSFLQFYFNQYPKQPLKTGNMGVTDKTACTDTAKLMCNQGLIGSDYESSL